MFCGWGFFPRLSLLLFPLLILGLYPTGAVSQGSEDPGSSLLDSGLPVLEAHPAEESIVLDGRISESAWDRAEPATRFIQRDPFEGELVSQETKVWVLYDEEALYVGAVMMDEHPVSTRLGRRDAWLMDSDWLTVSLDSYNDHRSGFKFQVNPSGVRSDEALSGGRDRHGDDSWDPVWKAATRVEDWGWAAELRIPFSQLRFRNADEQIWGIQITREIARNREDAHFSFTPKDERGGIPRYGHLVGLRGIRQSRGLELLPYVQGRAEYVRIGQDSDVDFANPFRDGSDLFYGAGVDLKYRLSSNFTVNATLNPDFGQVEVDPAVVNLSAYETRYQEKRPFFVEGADVFSFGGSGGGGGGMGRMFGGGGGGGGTQLLYSRRIGRPPGGEVPDEAVYADAPEATTILSAGKVTGRTAGGWSVGLLEAVTAREMAEYITETGETGEAEVEPLSNFFVARIRKDFREGRSAVGAIGTAVNRDLGSGLLAQELRSSAYALGLDFFHEWADRTWSLSGYAAGSRIAGTPEVMEDAQTSSARYYQRPDAHHIELDPDATSLSGYTATLELQRQAGLHWRGGVELSATSPGFEVNDLGYQRDADRRRAQVRLGYEENRPGDVFRRWQLNVRPESSWSFNGDRLDTSVSVSGNVTLLNYWSTRFSWERTFRSMDDRLTRGGPLASKPAGHRISLFETSDFSKPYSGMLSFRHQWDEAGSRRTTYSARLNIRPGSTWEVSLGPNLTLNRETAQYVRSWSDPLATETYGARYLFGKLEQTTLSMETRLNVTFTPNLTLELFAQPFMASGDYEAFKELRRAGTFDFIRYGVEGGIVSRDEDGDYVVDPDGDGPAESRSFTNPDFNRVSLRGTGVLRWEWRPGSTLFLVWQQNRSDRYKRGDFDLGRDAEALFDLRADNVFMVKATYWIGS